MFVESDDNDRKDDAIASRMLNSGRLVHNR